MCFVRAHCGEQSPFITKVTTQGDYAKNPVIVIISLLIMSILWTQSVYDFMDPKTFLWWGQRTNIRTQFMCNHSTKYTYVIICAAVIIHNGSSLNPRMTVNYRAIIVTIVKLCCSTFGYGIVLINHHFHYTVATQSLLINHHQSASVEWSNQPGFPTSSTSNPGWKPWTSRRAGGPHLWACYPVVSPLVRKCRTGGGETPREHLRNLLESKVWHHLHKIIIYNNDLFNDLY